MKKKNRNKNGVLKGVGALLLVGVLAAGVCCTGYASRNENGKWFANGDLSSWHWSDKKDDPEQNEPVQLECGGKMSLTNNNDSEESPITFTSAVLPRSAYAAHSVSETAENAYVVTATVLPDDTADNAAVEWSLSWKRTTDSWAYTASGLRDINEYVTLDSTDRKQVTVSCLKDFGEPIILTVKCVEAPEITSSIQLDYVARATFMMTYHNNSNVSWGRDTAVSLEIGSTGNYGSLYPTRIMYMLSGDYTVLDTYTFNLTMKGNGKPLSTEHGKLTIYNSSPMPAGITDFYFKDYSENIGTFELYQPEDGSRYQSFDVEYRHGEGSTFALRKEGIGTLIWTGNENDTLNSRITSGSFAPSAVKYGFSEYIQPEYVETPSYMPLCTLELSVKGLREENTFSSNILIREITNNAKLSGVDIDGGNIIF